MIIKVFKVVWFVSLLVMTGVFIYCYASWPQEVTLGDEQGTSIDRGILFYACLGLSAVFNSLAFFIVRMNFSKAFATWFYGLLISFHAFLVSGFIFITILNSLEKYDYSRFGPTLYGSMILLIVWIVCWPVYYVFNKISAQSKVG
jgi:hypothetical protein